VAVWDIALSMDEGGRQDALFVGGHSSAYQKLPEIRRAVTSLLRPTNDLFDLK